MILVNANGLTLYFEKVQHNGYATREETGTVPEWRNSNNPRGLTESRRGTEVTVTELSGLSPSSVSSDPDDHSYGYWCPVAVHGLACGCY